MTNEAGGCDEPVPARTGGAPDAAESLRTPAASTPIGRLNYRRVFEAAPTRALLVAPEPPHVVVAASEALLGALAREREDVVGQPFASLFVQNPDHVAVLRHVIARRVPESTSLQRHEVTARDGKTSAHWWSVTFTPIVQADALECIEARFEDGERTDGARSEARKSTPPLVLVVDDDAMLSKLISACLSPYYRVMAAFDGLEGLQAASAFTPDLILCDLRLPGLNGEQFVREVRLWNALDDTPIIIITASEDGELRSRLIEAGAQDYLTKPFSMQELRVRVGGLIARREAQERARVLSEELSARKELERSRAEWAAIVAHDLRQPVNAMAVASAVLAKSYDRGDDPADRTIQRRSIERILTTARRMSAMVDDLLDVSSIEARCFAIERQACLLTDVIDEALEPWSDQRERFHVDVDEHAREPLWLDPRRIFQVMTNLFSNAAKYGVPGTPILVSATGGAGHVEVSVTNTGRGVSQAELEGVFERYARGRESRKAPGLGLGLFICRGIVEAHGGRITASCVGDQVTFRVVLPLRDPAERS